MISSRSAIESRRARNCSWVSISFAYLAESWTACSMASVSSSTREPAPRKSQRIAAGPTIQPTTASAVQRSTLTPPRRGSAGPGAARRPRRFLPPGSRLTSITSTSPLKRSRPSQRQPDREHEHRGKLVHVDRFHDLGPDRDALERAREFGPDAEPRAERVDQARRPRTTAGDEDAPQVEAPGVRGEEGDGALDPERELVDALVDEGPDVDGVRPALDHILGLVSRQPALALERLAQPPRAERDVADDDRDGLVQQVHVRRLVADVDQRDEALERVRIVP